MTAASSASLRAAGLGNWPEETIWEKIFLSTFNIAFNPDDCTQSPAIRLAIETNFTVRKEFNQDLPWYSYRENIYI